VRPLVLIRSWVLGNGTEPHRATEDSLTHQQVTIDAIRDRLSGADRRTFDRGLETALAANFAWWNEEHNAHIDLRLHLPVRRAGRAMAARYSRDPDSGLLLFTEEIRLLASGARSWAEYAPLVHERRQWRAAWVERRPQLPRTVGSADASEPDPVMREVIGVRPGSGAFPTSTTLTGLPVSVGTARGLARVVLSADDLALVEPGDVLVCEASSPSWTPVFARVAGCVCDSGGALTHAAIICREYAIPCVCAVGIATRVIRNGDVIELDGATGTITLIRTQP
jgi:phosphohistidine swiveling domain-containing protein